MSTSNPYRSKGDITTPRQWAMEKNEAKKLIKDHRKSDKAFGKLIGVVLFQDVEVKTRVAYSGSLLG